jgi:hypothetical protein
MARTPRLSTTGVLIVCLVGTQLSGTLFASDEELSSRATPSSQSVVNSTSDVPEETALPGPVAEASAGGQPAGGTEPPRSTVERPRFTFNNSTGSLGPASAEVWQRKFVSIESSSFAQRNGYGGRRRGDRNGAAAALVLGAVASITGTAILVYANRPECNSNQLADGCGYGTKVVGGAVLSAGIVGLVAGALRWR